MLARISIGLVSLLFLGILAGCGGGSDDRSFQSPAGLASVSDEREMSAESPDEDAVVESPGNAMDGQFSSAAQIGIFDRRVIRNGELVLSVSDVGRSVRHARNIAEEYGGHVAASSARTFGIDDEIADITLEVPSGDFDAVMDALRTGPHVERVDHEVTSSRDVTEEYVDLRARLANLQAAEQRFIRLLDDARTIDEVLQVERELTRVRGEIEQIQGRLNYLEQRTDYSRIHIQFQLVSEPLTVAGWEFHPGESAREAWNASMEFLGTLAHGLILVTVFFWWAWPLLIAAIVVLWRYQRRRRMIATESPA